MNRPRYYLLACAALSGCSAPETPTSAYPQDAAISSPAGVPHDSAVSYFPASAIANTSPDSLTRQLGDCRFEFRMASDELFGFKAPVLSNYYLGHAIYRFLWSPALRLPVLLTLELNGTNGVLKTQFVNRYPEPMASAAEVEAESRPEIEHINQLKSLIKAGQDVSDNTERLIAATDRLAYIKLSGTPLIITGSVVALQPSQVRQFTALLDRAKFWQLPSCEPSACFDGAGYVLEAHEVNRYRVVKRQCFMDEGSSFYQCCKFLLDLSPAKPKAQP
jgi:hypothetical protein